jgi:hypothetical protein
LRLQDDEQAVVQATKGDEAPEGGQAWTTTHQASPSFTSSFFLP